jgi:two-component system OmpR family response regulator
MLDMSQSIAGPPRIMSKLLLIEDDDETAIEVVGELTQRGYAVEHAAVGTAGLELARSGNHDVLIVDRLLPEIDGLAIIETLRREHKRTPVLVLSALGALDDRVRGLRAGGDDYLVKPFALIELIARIEALLRRPAVGRETRLRVGPLELDLIERTVTRSGRKIDLLPRELRLLEYLMRRPDQVVTRAMLFEDVWNYRFVPDSNLVDVHMGKLRHKIDAPGDEPIIQNVRGSGFVLRANG